MITELRVRNLATVSEATLQLGPGLNVLTGETGAGKSMLVDALALLLGERADTQTLRPGTTRAVIEGVVDEIDDRLARRIESLGLDVDEGRVIIRREVASEGRSRAWVNGSPTTVKILARLGALLVDLISGTPPTRVATAGVPQAIDSSSTLGQPSRADARTETSAAP